MRALALIDAWKGKGTAGTNGFKYFAVLGGLPVGDARLPSMPLNDLDKGALKESFDAFCGSEGKGLKMCEAV